jgi:carboxypeptidase PM20D1
VKRGLAVLSLALALLCAVLLGRALVAPSKQVTVAAAPRRALDEAALAAGLAEALRFPTISHLDPGRLPADDFRAFQDWLAQRYPLMHATLDLERVSDWSLLYTWAGRRPDLPPVVFLAHQDVVPAPDADRWTHPPFAGVVADGFVWGRGAMDDKGSLVALCEAVELLLREGRAPERPVILAFGHDEELGGDAGAAGMAERLAARGVRAELVLDEGLAILVNVIPGLARPAALVGVAEKGYATLILRVTAPGGHSSTPPRRSAIGQLAAAVRALEEHPMPGGLFGLSRTFFEYLAPEMPLAHRVALANLWLTRPLVERVLGSDPAVDAALRTTTAVTLFHAGEKDNVLPSSASAMVNFRIRPGDTSEDVLAHARRVIADDAVEIRFSEKQREPSAVSPVDSPAFAALQRAIAETTPDAVVAPTLVLGGTDARHYAAISPNLYRFLPFQFDRGDATRAHGIDERLSVATLADGVRFYAHLMERPAGAAR